MVPTAGFAGEVHYSFDVVCTQFPPVTPRLFIKTANQSFRKHAQRRVFIELLRRAILVLAAFQLQRRHHVVHCDAYFIAVLACQSLETILDQHVPEVSFFARQSCQLAEVADNRWGEIPLDYRQ